MFVKTLFLYFRITHGGDLVVCTWEDPEENVLFSHLIFIIPLFSVCFQHSKGWIHYADTVHKIEKVTHSNFFIVCMIVSPQLSHIFSKSTWHCGFTFAKMTFLKKKQKKTVGTTLVLCVNYGGTRLMFEACRCCSFFPPFTRLYAPLSQHKKWCHRHTGGLLPLGSNQTITNG